MLIVSAPCSRCRSVTVAAPQYICATNKAFWGTNCQCPNCVVNDRRRCTVHPIIKQHLLNIRVWVPFLCSHDPTLTIMPTFDPHSRRLSPPRMPSRRAWKTRDCSRIYKKRSRLRMCGNWSVSVAERPSQPYHEELSCVAD